MNNNDMNMADKMIIAENQYYSMDCYKTKLNNNVLVCGTSGSGKTRGFVEPNILQATGSYIVTDPKGNLYQRYSGYLREKGYKVKKLDFTNPRDSAHYNFFKYIHNTQDIVKIAHMLIYQDDQSRKSLDPFWDQAAQLLLQSVISYLREEWPRHTNLKTMLKTVAMCNSSGDLESNQTQYDGLMMELGKKTNQESYAFNTYVKFRVAADKTLRSILITIFGKLGLFDTPEVNELTKCDDINIPKIGQEKTALFVVVSDTDRSLDALVNIFFTQAMNELCLFADKKCIGNKLPVPVRFIMDDFATNCRINDFPRMISSIRSRNISAALIIQAEGQLNNSYGEDGKTIISNCDTYLYLGSNDLETAKAISERTDTPLKKILYMPVGKNWIFRRGEMPVNGTNFDLEPFYELKMTQRQSISRAV